MFYDAIANSHGLRHDPFKALVAPRPIGWISTMGADGSVNLAPYSFFNAVGDRPNYVMFSSTGRKDSCTNAAETGAFVCSLATWDLREAMNMTSAPVERGVDEFEFAGLTKAPCELVAPPRVKESPVALECVFEQAIVLESYRTDGHVITIGKVVGIHIDDRFIHDGMVDTAAMKPIARCGYHDYSVVTELFQMRRPDAEEALKVLAETRG